MTDDKNPGPEANDEDAPEVEAAETERLVTFSSANNDYAWFEDCVEAGEDTDAEPSRTIVAVDRETFDALGEPTSLIVTVQPAD